MLLERRLNKIRKKTANKKRASLAMIKNSLNVYYNYLLRAIIEICNASITAIAPIIGNNSELTCNDACSILSTAEDIADTLESIIVTLSLSFVLASSSVTPNPWISVCNVSSSDDAVVNTSLRVIICLDIPAMSSPRTRVAAEPCDSDHSEIATKWIM